MRKELIVHRDPKSPVSEVFRTLRTNIQFMNTNNKLKTLLVTSTLPGEGKSWTTANLAVTFAQAGKKVILVDADMRKGRQYTIFEVSPRPGLSNYLSGVDANTGEELDDDLTKYLQRTQVQNLLVMSAGNIPPNPSELLISTKMINLLDQLKEICDIVIIDGTPCELVTDSIILARLVDSTIIVTAHKQTKKDVLQKTVTSIQNVGGKIAGIVLNKIPISNKKYEQAYYYGSNGSKFNDNRRKSDMNIRTNTRKNAKMEEMKSRINPVNPQSLRNEELRETTNNETLESKLRVEKKEELPMEKSEKILEQINEYLNKEKNSK